MNYVQYICTCMACAGILSTNMCTCTCFYFSTCRCASCVQVISYCLSVVWLVWLVGKGGRYPKTLCIDYYVFICNSVCVCVYFCMLVWRYLFIQVLLPNLIMLYSLPVLMYVRCCSVMPSLLYNRVVDELLQWSPYCSYIVLTRDRSQGLGTMCVSILHVLHVYVCVCVCLYRRVFFS